MFSLLCTFHLKTILLYHFEKLNFGLFTSEKSGIKKGALIVTMIPSGASKDKLLKATHSVPEKCI